MSKKIEVRCPHCDAVNKFDKSDLVSGMSIKDDAGNVVEEHPEVEIDEYLFIQCESCGRPISCANATISN